MSTLTIHFIGHASFKFESQGETIYFDPWLAPENPVAKVSLKDVKKATTVVCTHGHIDHLGQSIEICNKTKACFISTPEVGMYCDLYGIPYDTEPYAYALNVGGSGRWGKVVYTCVNALHSTNIMGDEYRAEKRMFPDGQTVGYVMTFDNARPGERGIVLYDSGDTGPFGDMQLIRNLYQPQICIMPAGGQYNMGIREFAYACGLLTPEVVIPCHYDTFPRQRQDMKKLTAAVAVTSPKTQVVVLKPGASYTFRR